MPVATGAPATLEPGRTNANFVTRPVEIDGPRSGRGRGRLVERYRTPGSAQTGGVGTGSSGSAGTQAPAAPPGVSLSFDRADVREMLKVTLGDVLRLNYAIDPAVTGTVTLHTSRPIPRADVLHTVESVLEGQGFALIRTNGLYRVTARTEGRNGRPARAATNQAVRVFAPQHVAATELKSLLDQIWEDQAVSVEGANRNILLVSGRPADVSRIGDLVESFDVPQMAGMSMMLVGLNHADPETMVAELRGVMGVPDGVVRFVPVDRLSAIVATARDESYLDATLDWVRRLDRERVAATNRLYVYFVQNRRATDLAQSLNDLFAVQGGPAAVVPVRQEGGDTPPPTRPAPVSALQVEDWLEDVRIVVDEEKNALLVASSTGQFAMIRDILAQLDVMPLQVMIEATIIEVDLRDNLQYGVAYAIESGYLGNSDLQINTIFNPAGAAQAIAPALPGFAAALQESGTPNVIVNALAEVTDVKVVSSPKLMVLDNQPARLQVGDSVPIVTQQTTSVETANPLIVNAVQYRDTGVTLEVTPRVSPNGLVNMEIVQEVSDVVPTSTSGIDSPTIQQRRVLTTVAIQTGRTVMLGGLIRDFNSQGEVGIPLLKDIPLVGNVFSDTVDQTRRTELIALLTPHVVRTDSDAVSISARLARKFEAALQIKPADFRLRRPDPDHRRAVGGRSARPS